MQIEVKYKVSTSSGVRTSIIYLPVAPENIRITESVKSQTVSTLGGIDRIVLGNQELKKVEIASFFPKYKFSIMQGYDFNVSPSKLAEVFKKLVQEKVSLTLKIHDKEDYDKTTNLNIELPCYLTSFEYGEVGGSTDLNYTMTFMERRDVNIDWKTAEDTGVSLDGRMANVSKPSTYTVASGDTLWKIAQKTLGDGDRWKELYNANKDLIGNNPNLIYPGQRLVLVDVE